MKSPKVFISYSHDSPTHEDRVLQLADQLNQAGIDCMIDQYEPASASGWLLWMEEQIEAADFVLLVCTETYNLRVHRKDSGKGYGVCWEANIIYIILYAKKLENEKFIPILFDAQDQKHIPLPLMSYAYYLVDTKEGWEELYRRLTKQPKAIKPQTGAIIKFPIRQRRSSYFDGQESTAVETPNSCVHNLPLFNESHHFGREEFLEQLNMIFRANTTTTLTQAITGLGGVGKTQIALAYAYTYKDNYRQIWWVRAENPTTCDLDYQEFAWRMGLCEPEADRKEIITKVRDWQEKKSNWLFIYDNAMDYAVLQEYVPRFPKGHILLTTRKNFFEIGNPLLVDVFSPEDAGKFLCFRTKQDELTSSLELAQELGRLPLALEQAAAYIEKNHLTIQTYLDLFRKNRKNRLRLLSITQPPVNYRYTVATTWQISLNQITREATRQLLYISAFLDPEHVSKQLFWDGAIVLPRPLAEAVTDDIAFNEMLIELETYSLIHRADDELWSIHQLMQEVVRESLAQDCHDWVKTVMELLYQIYSFDYYQQKTWEKAKRLISHIQNIVDIAVSLQIKNDRLGWLSNEIGEYFDYQGRYKDAGVSYKRALDIRIQALGMDHPDTATTLNNLASLFKKNKKYEDAERQYRRALDIRERIQGPDHSDTAISLNDLAELYRIQGRYQEAESLYIRALKIYELLAEPDHPDKATLFNNLALLYKSQVRYEEAEPLYKRALEISERELGPDHPDTAISLNNLAGLYYTLGQYEKAEVLYRRALEIFIKVFGKEHSNTQICFNNLNKLYPSHNQVAAAHELMKQPD